MDFNEYVVSRGFPMCEIYYWRTLHVIKLQRSYYYIKLQLLWV